MSALRINVPGQPIRFIDLGPAVGRCRDFVIGVTTGPAMIPPAPGLIYTTPAAQERKARRAAAYRERQRTSARNSDPEACRSRQEVKA